MSTILHIEHGDLSIGLGKPVEPLEKEMPDSAKRCIGYTTNEFPVDMNNDKDVQTYQHYLENKLGITISGGTILHFVGMLPGALSPSNN
jgi:hypothetical protein